MRVLQPRAGYQQPNNYVYLGMNVNLPGTTEEEWEDAVLRARERRVLPPPSHVVWPEDARNVPAEGAAQDTGVGRDQQADDRWAGVQHIQLTPPSWVSRS